MMKHLLLVLFLAPSLLFAAPSTAKINQLMEVLRLNDTIDSQRSAAEKQIGGLMQNMPLDKMSTEDKTWLEGLYKDLLNDMFDKVLPIIKTETANFYKSRFTEAEIDGLIDWYSTDLGKKFAAVTPELSSTITAKTNEVMMAEMPGLMQKVMAEMQTRFAN